MTECSIWHLDFQAKRLFLKVLAVDLLQAAILHTNSRQNIASEKAAFYY